MTDVRADVITLTTGESLEGDVVAQDEADTHFVHPVLGTLTIPTDAIATCVYDTSEASVPRGGNGALAETASDEAATAESTSAGNDAADTEIAAVAATHPTSLVPVFAEWNTQLECGVNGQHGNSESIDIRLAVALSRESDSMRTAIDTSYVFGESFGDRAAHRFTAGARNDWKLPTLPIFYFAQGRFDLDEFQPWDYRYHVGGGVGYEILDDPESVRLIARAGLGGRQEFGDEQIDNDIMPEAIVGLDLGWKLSEAQSLTAGTTWYPNVDDADDYRLVVNADWTFHLDHAEGIDFKLGLLNEYRSMADAEARNNDLRIYSAVVLRF